MSDHQPEDRLVSAGQQIGDAGDAGMRPVTLDDFIGQAKVRGSVQMIINPVAIGIAGIADVDHIRRIGAQDDPLGLVATQ